MALTVGELVAFLRVDKGQYTKGLAEGRAEAHAAGRDIGQALEFNVDAKGNLNRYAQRLRDVRTLYTASIKPVRDYSTQVAGLALKAGVASTALGGGIGLAGVVSSLIFSLGSVGAALPVVAVGLLGVAAISRTAKIALAGVGDALNDKIGDAFDKISPKAQRFVDQFGAIVPQLAKVKNAIQDSLFDKLGQSIGPLAERYLPLLTRNGTAFADALNGAARTAAQGLLDPTTVSSLNTVMGKLSGILEGFLPSLRGVIPLLAQVLLSGIPGLQQLGDKASGVVERFKKALASGLQSGGLERAVTGGLNAATQLGGVLADVLVILFKIGQAAHEAFGNPLAELHDLTQGVRQWVSSTRGQATITGLFSAFAPVLAGIVDVLRLLAPEVLSLLPLIRDLAVTFLDGLKPVIPVLGDLVRTIGEGLIAVLPIVSKFAVALGGFLVQALDLLVPLITPLGDALVTLLSPTGLLIGLLDALGPVLVPLASGLGQVVTILAGGLLSVVEALAPSLPGFVQAIVDLAVALAESLGQALEQIAPMLPELVDALTQFLIALTPLLPIIVPLIPPLVELAVAALIPLAHALRDLAPFVIDMAGYLVWFGQQTAAAVEQAMDYVRRLINAFRSIAAADGIPAAIKKTVEWILSLPSRAASLPASMSGLAGRALFSFQDKLNRGLASVFRWAASIPQTILAGVGDLSGVLLGAGGQVISGLVSGIRNALPDLSGILRTVTNLIPNLKGPPEKDRRLLNPAGRSLIAGLVGGIKAEVPSLRSTLADVTRLIPADAGALSLQANREATAALTARATAQADAGTGKPAVVQLGDVHVFIGDEEITDMIRVEVAAHGKATTATAYAGSGRRAG